MVLAENETKNNLTQYLAEKLAPTLEPVAYASVLENTAVLFLKQKI